MSARKCHNSSTFYREYLRPPVISTLSAAGFTRTRPGVLETVQDLTSRYMALLCEHTAAHARLRRENALNSGPLSPESSDNGITITDIRLALTDVGALYPQISEMEEALRSIVAARRSAQPSKSAPATKAKQKSSEYTSPYASPTGDGAFPTSPDDNAVTPPGELPHTSIPPTATIAPVQNTRKRKRDSPSSQEDLRGIEAFLQWCRGPQNAEIRRVAGMVSASQMANGDAAVAAAIGANTSSAASNNQQSGTQPQNQSRQQGPGPVGGGSGGRGTTATAEDMMTALQADGMTEAGPEDYLTVLKKKHRGAAASGAAIIGMDPEDAKWAGTIFGPELPPRPLNASNSGGDDDYHPGRIAGWDELSSLDRWGDLLKQRRLQTEGDEEDAGKSKETSAPKSGNSSTSSPLSEFMGSPRPVGD